MTGRNVGAVPVAPGVGAAGTATPQEIGVPQPPVSS